jgi:hypothetical protein
MVLFLHQEEAMRRFFLVSAAVLFLGFLFLSPACGGLGIAAGSGRLTTQDLAFSDFTRVEASYAFSVDIQQGAAFSVKITTDDNLTSYLRISKNGDTLVLAVLNGYSYPNATFRAQVTMPDLRQLSVSGASHATVSGFTARHDLKSTASGASTASFLNMQVGTLDTEASGASSTTGDISADGNATLSASGASSIELNGRALDLIGEASGASQLRLGSFAVRNAQVNLSGASQGKLNASGTLSGSISGASHLGYLDTPTLGNLSTSGGSSVSKE